MDNQQNSSGQLGVQDHVDFDEASIPPEEGAMGSRPDPKRSRRRTKTGCLTCRRRRIKCGEERPICANCIKSKRQCEGYNQRVIFKDPHTFRGPMSDIPAHNGFVARHYSGATHSINHLPISNSQQQASLQNILPRTHSLQFANTFAPTQFQSFVYNEPAAFHAHQRNGLPLAPTSHIESQNPVQQTRPFFQTSQINESTSDQHSGRDSSSPQLGSDSHGSFHVVAHPGEPQSSAFSDAQLQMRTIESRHGGRPNNGRSNDAFHEESPLGLVHNHPEMHRQGGMDYIGSSSDNSGTPFPRPSLSPSQGTSSQLSLGGSDTIITTISAQVDMEYEDEDDPYDVSSDDDDEDTRDIDDGLDRHTRSLHRRMRDNDQMQVVMAIQAAQDSQDTRIRTYHSVIENYGPDMLVDYYPSSKDSPLRDPVAASVFSHFINVIAPGISMYERHPANPSLLFQGQPVPKSQQHIWAYTMPTIALRNHALLHAMLAMASLHIAKLQNTPVIASLKHYHLAIRKLAKNVGLPSRRKQLATLATTLLLGYYEVMSADHSKWCDHLLGAHQLVKQIDFAGMTKYLRNHKRHDSKPLSSQHYSWPAGAQNNYHGGIEHTADDEIDENFVGILMGKSLNYANYGEVLEEHDDTHAGHKRYTQRDLDMFDTQRDLFWWYIKQDALQSILSQNRLFLTYDRWSHCPPRAPIGRRNAVHGTFDHLVLLLGRLAEFAAKDLKRKKKVLRANGGILKPPSGMQMPPTSRSAPSHQGRGHPSTRINEFPAEHRGAFANGSPPGWTGPPPPGWTGALPPDFHSVNQNSPPYHQHGHKGRGTRLSSEMSGQSDQRRSGPSVGPPSGRISHGEMPPMPIMPQLPSFAGMLPVGEKAKLPRGFSPSADDSPSPSSEEDDGQLDEETQRAEEEWLAIRKAFSILEEHFGPDFQPLGSEYVQAIECPFGTAIQYRTYSIAVIWLMYYMGLIICHRAHPSMPPAAMVAAGFAAQNTAFFANEIGRIAAGMAPDARTATSVNISTGSGLTDSAFALFVAGVQLQDGAQRKWLIQRMLDIERLTGWESASQVAKGCETSWRRTADMGRGPPYTRYVEPMPVNRIWNRAGERIERMWTTVGEPTHANPHSTAVSGRVQWALGLIGIEEAVADLKLQSNDDERVEQDSTAGRHNT